MLTEMRYVGARKDPSRDHWDIGMDTGGRLQWALNPTRAFPRVHSARDGTDYKQALDTAVGNTANACQPLMPLQRDPRGI